MHKNALLYVSTGSHTYFIFRHLEQVIHIGSQSIPRLIAQLNRPGSCIQCPFLEKPLCDQ